MYVFMTESLTLSDRLHSEEPHYSMHNESGNIALHCDGCDEMKKLVSWFPGLVIKLISLATLSVLTTSANVFLIYIACRAKSLVSNTKVFFISLCVAHLLGSVIVIPLWIVTRLTTDLATDSPFFCQIAGFVWVLMILASFYSLSALSLDRFFIISDPMRYPLSATTPKKLIAVTILWIFCVLFASAPIMGWGEYIFEPDAIPICGLNMKHSFSFTIIFIIVGHCVPLLVDIFCCGKIIAIARRQSISIETRKDSSGSTTSITSDVSSSSTTVIHPTSNSPTAKLSKLKQKLNSLRLVFAGTGSFLVCWLPYLAAHIWMTTIRNIGHDEESMPYILEFVVMCIALLNGFVNPVVIMISNRDYRKRIKMICRKLKLIKATEPMSYDSHELDSSDNYHRRSVQHKNMTDVFQNLNTCIENLTPAFYTKEKPFQHSLSVVADINTVEVTCDSKDTLGDICSTTKDGIAINVRESRRLLSRTSLSSVGSQDSTDETVSKILNPYPGHEKETYLEVPGRTER